MVSRTLSLWLMIGVIVPFIASADQLISDNLIVSGASDGTAPAYTCAAGDTLPFDSELLVDVSSLPMNFPSIPAGDPIIQVNPVVNNCDFSQGIPYTCEYTCETPTSAACVGLDCMESDSFAEGELRLEENNVGIRFDIPSIDPGLLGRSWSVIANSTRNNGASFFDFELKSLEADTVHLVTVKDGEQPSYDCSVLVNPNTFFQNLDDLIIGIIPVGEPLTFPEIIQSSCSGAPLLCEIECAEVISFEEKSVLILGPASADPVFGGGVAVGYESAVEGGAVSVGRADLVRRIAHVAAGIGGTNALSLANFDLLAQQIADTNAQLDAIEAEIVFLEENPAIETVVLAVMAEIDALLMDPGVSDKAKKNLDKSSTELAKALDQLENGDVGKGLKGISKAIKELFKAAKEGADVLDLIDPLVESSRAEAQAAIDAAVAAGGKQKDIDKAQAEMTKAQKELDKGKPDKAVDKYNKAWDKARKATA